MISNYQRLIDGYLAGLDQETLAKASIAVNSGFAAPILDIGFLFRTIPDREFDLVRGYYQPSSTQSFMTPPMDSIPAIVPPSTRTSVPVI